MTALSACREATQALCSLLVLDLSEGSRDFLASFAVGLDLGLKPIRQGFHLVLFVMKNRDRDGRPGGLTGA